MPPKAKKPDNKNQEPVEDETGIPKNEVTFKFSFEVKQSEIADIMIMFEWISANNTATREKFDTDLIESWDPKSSEDPTIVTYEMELPTIRVEDNFAKNICSSKFYVHFVSVEDQCVKDTIYLNYSPLLTAKGEVKFETYHTKIKIVQIEHMRLTVTADKELLTPMFRDFLNPLEICILGAKEMPANNSGYNKYEPVYVEAKFFDGTIIKTHELPHRNTYTWMYKQVILAGLIDHIKLMEDLRSRPLIFEVHDQDESASNQIKNFKELINVEYKEEAPPVEVDPKAKGKNAPPPKGKEPEKKDNKAKEPAGKDAKGKKDAKKKKDVKTFEPIFKKEEKDIIKSNYGVSSFHLNDFLNPHVTSLKLRNFVFPLKKYENRDSKNLDLNTTARREIQELNTACDYMSSGSYLAVTFNIAHAIRPFKKAEPKKSEEGLNIDQTGIRPKSKQAAEPKGIAPGPQKGKRGTLVNVEVDAKALKAPEEKPIFERAVFIFPYKSPELTTRLLSTVQEINMAAFDVPDKNPLFLTTKVLTEEEKNDRDLNIITGVEFIDFEQRIFVIEGLSDKAMKRIEEVFPRTQLNSNEFKMMRNSDIKFKDRLYLNFNIDIKKIKLRETLSKLLAKSDIYMRSKVPEQIYNVLMCFNDLKRCDNLKAVVSANLFPDPEYIISMERKYGDALTDEDITGKECPPQKAIKKLGRSSKLTQEFSGIQNMSTSLVSDDSKVKKLELSNDIERLPTIRSNNRTSTSTKLIARREKVQPESYSMHMTRLYPVKKGEQVYTNAEGRHNIYEQQRAELREIARNDPNNFYTYSADFLSLSIDPYTPEEVQKFDQQKNKSLWKTKDGFHTILKKVKKDYIMHQVKPHESKIEEINTYPYHKMKMEETKQLSNSRGDPIRNGPDFKLNIHTEKVFSNPEVLAGENITAVERERQIKEAKKKAEEETKAKMIVDASYVNVSLCMSRNSQLDKIKGIRDAEPKKKSLILRDRRLKNTTLGMTKSIEENPISMYLVEKWEEQPKNFCERNVDPQRTTSQFDFNTNIKIEHQKESIYKPLKDLFKPIL